jgi:predicted amidophosphoribosyltransferase
MEYVKDENGFIELPADNECPSCGFELSDGDRFCPKCGKPVEDSDKTFRVSPCCPECRSVIHPDMAFCTVCGKPLGKTPMITDGTITCHVCGAAHQPLNRTRCWSCGAEFVIPGRD